MKLSDYVAQFLADQGIGHVFGLTGGAVVHLFDSISKQPGLEPVFTHHEQAAAFAAEAYAKVHDSGLGACLVTTGPGGTNAITGLSAAWLDSIPCFYFSGQVRRAHISAGKGIRQLGTQELDILSIVSSVTKYAVTVEDPGRIRYHLEKALYYARQGRPGPVWIDIPLDIQWAMIEPEALQGFQAPSVDQSLDPSSQMPLILKAKALLEEAHRPLVIVGNGVRLSGGVLELRSFIQQNHLPFVSSWNACDLFDVSDPLYVGRLGICGQRGANLAVQNSDLLIILGSHLCLPQTGTNIEGFSRLSKKIIVNIDAAELEQQRIVPDVSILSDAQAFLKIFLSILEVKKRPKNLDWLHKCGTYKRYNGPSEDWKSLKNAINSYVVVDAISDQLTAADQVVVDGGGMVVYSALQAFKTKLGQRLILSSGLCSMGSGLPESIGVCFANGRKKTLCLVGDGSFQLNIQELQTIVHHQLPIKIFLFNNQGYLSIRHTQAGFLNHHYVGTHKEGGLSFPNFRKVVEAYGLRTHLISDYSKLVAGIADILADEGPAFCEIIVPPDQAMTPSQGFVKQKDGSFRPRPLEDMTPYLARDELQALMCIALMEE